MEIWDSYSEQVEHDAIGSRMAWIVCAAIGTWAVLGAVGYLIWRAVS